MEYPIKDDFFLEFKAIYNEKEEFLDYILVNTSQGFKSMSGKPARNLIGESLASLIISQGRFIPGDRELFYYMIPNTKRKFQRYFEETNTWYFINVFSDKNESLFVFYTNISRLKNKRKSKEAKDLDKTLYEKKLIEFHKDKLTGLYNRTFFEIELARLDTERQLPLSFVTGDLNGLKLINDAFGHNIGDEALKRSAMILRKVFRKEDIVCRFGGDEYGIILPNTNENTALEIIKRLKAEFARNPLDHIQLNMSFGVATKTNMEEDINEIMIEAEQRMYFNKLIESKAAKQNMLHYLRNKLKQFDGETKQSHKRLKDLSMEFAQVLNLNQMQKEELNLLCEFHDIGKTGIPNYILQKKEPLTKEEWKKIKRHSEIGYNIMRFSREKMAIDDLILSHHERWDGKGYPGLLKGEDIPLISRVFFIVDAYEAMINDRPYKGKISPQEALREIRQNAGSQFDPYLTERFVDMMEEIRLNIG